MNKLLSVVMPVYNVKSYIEKALDSLVNQSYLDFQLIIVDDGSTDNSLDIVDKYKNYFKDLTIVKQNNSGVSAARNTGFDLCTGKYVLFLDSDDFYDSEMLEHLIELSENEKADVVSCKYRIIDNSVVSKAHINENKEFEKTTLNEDILIKEFLLHKNIDGYVWNKLFRVDFLKAHNIKFIEGKLYEDTLMIFEVLLQRPKLVVSNRVLYNYVKRSGSLITRTDNKAVTDLLENVDFIQDKLYRFNLMNSHEAEFQYNSMLIYMQALILLQRLSLVNGINNNLSKSLLSKLHYNNKYLIKRDKIYIFMLKTNLIRLYIKLLRK